MLIENQNNLNEVDLESDSTKKFETVPVKSNRKLGIRKTDKIKCSNRYGTLYTVDNDEESYNSYDSSTPSDSSTSSDKIYGKTLSGNIGTKEEKSKNFNEKEGNEREGQ